MTGNTSRLALIADKAGTGKTTLLEAIIMLLKSKGYRVGAVKHSSHEVSFDKAGSDSWRFTRAGSDVTVLASKGQLAVIRTPVTLDVEDALREASRDTDIVLIEGFKEMDLPKMEVFRSGHSDILFCRNENHHDPNLVAVVSDTSMDLDVPVLDLNAPEEVCGFIIEQFLRKTEGNH